MVKFTFRSIKIEELGEASSVNSGDNILVNRNHSKKINEGLGSMDGFDNIFIGNMNAVFDRDSEDVVVKRS